MTLAVAPSRRELFPDPPEQGWAEFLSYFAREWRQGDHVTMIGPTNSGKTTLATKILPIRKYVVVLANKPRDETMSKLAHEGYMIQEKLSLDLADRIVLWPMDMDAQEVYEQHKALFERALRSVYYSGGWTIFLDEATYLSDYLKLRKLLELLWQQGRSIGITIVAGTQRPVNIPLYAYDQATHLFFWGDNDERNLARIGGLGGIDAAPVRVAVSRLGEHEVLYLNTRTGKQVKTKVRI